MMRWLLPGSTTAVYGACASLIACASLVAIVARFRSAAVARRYENGRSLIVTVQVSPIAGWPVIRKTARVGATLTWTRLFCPKPFSGENASPELYVGVACGVTSM